MSYAIPSQPQMIPLSEKSVSGYISLSDRSEYFISANYTSKPPNITVDSYLQEELDKYPAKFAEIISHSLSPRTFVENLVKFLDEVAVSPTDKSQLLNLIKQVATLPPDSIKSIDKDFKQITLQHVDDSDRTHFIAIQVDLKTPKFVCDLLSVSYS